MHFKNEETNIQVAVINYIKAKYPDVLFTIAPNGIKLNPWIGKMFKAMGYAPGTPDILIFKPKQDYHGAFIEIKTTKGVVSPAQKEFMKELDRLGYFTYVAFGYLKALEAIDEYLGGA